VFFLASNDVSYTDIFFSSCILYFIAASSVYSLAYFFPIILREGMGFSYAKAQLLSSPPYVGLPAGQSEDWAM
jgi:hypothetical protein